MVYGGLSLLLPAATNYNTDISYMAQHISVPYFIYRAGNTSHTHNHPNLANEALGYLTFIAEYYNCLPNVSYEGLTATTDTFAHISCNFSNIFQRRDVTDRFLPDHAMTASLEIIEPKAAVNPF